jgi:tetratricopeptide (TPR) repeat protein
MKNLLVKSLLLVFITGTTSFAQDNTLETAFSQSYTAEYSGNYTKAVKILKDKYDENSYEINLRLGWLSYNAGQYTDALTYYQKAINLMPMSIEARLGYVYPAAALSNWTQVNKTYNEILKIDPKNATAIYRLGLMNYNKKNYKAAYSYLSKNINLYPFDYDNLILFAWTNFQLGKLREAKVLFNKVLLNKPSDSSAKEGLALIK